MPEGQPQPDRSKEEREQIDVRNLSFSQLQEAVELAKTSFRQTNNGFENAYRDGVHIR